ncbi:MAG TPA: hypothetical protein VMU62_04170 [Acidobacteriaceae bacterium]|nr:hypothetical protein [Acidobacteriaceae bacterium]
MSTLAFSQAASHPTDSQWALEQSTLTYHMSHPLHQVDGVSNAAKGKGVCHADLEVQFAGQDVHYAHVPFQRVTQGNEVHIPGIVPATCVDFKIDPPSFLTVPIKNDGCL